MSSTTSSYGMFLASAVAVSGTVLLLAYHMQKLTDKFLVNPLFHQSRHTHDQLPRSCLSLGGKRKVMKKKVHFAIDVVVPLGNSEEYRKMHQIEEKKGPVDCLRESEKFKKRVKEHEMSANRMALYSGILKDQVRHRLARTC